EKPFTAEQRALDVADVLNVVVDARLARHETSRSHTQRFTRLQLAPMNRAARMDEQKTVALQPLENESLAAEEARAEPLRERDTDAHALRRTQERVLLREQLAAELLQMNRDDLARIRRAERDLL